MELDGCEGNHGQMSGRDPWLGAIGQSRGNAHGRASGRRIMLDDCPCANFGKIADADISQNGGARTEQDAAADPGRTARQRLPAADGHVLVDRHLVADDGECTDDDAGGVIEKYRRADRRRGMNTDLKRVGRQALQQKRLIRPVLAPEPIRHAPGLQGDVSLEVEKRRQQRRHRGIVNGNALEIAARRIDQVGRGCKCLTGNACKLAAIRRTPAEPLTDLMGQRTAEIGMI